MPPSQSCQHSNEFHRLPVPLSSAVVASIVLRYEAWLLQQGQSLCELAHLIHLAPLADALHGSKDLLPADLHAVLHIAEHSRLNKVALLATRLATTPAGAGLCHTHSEQRQLQQSQVR